jgi:hypothetical protein
MANLWSHPSRSPAPAIDQRTWATDTDRDIKVDYKQLVLMGDNVLGLNVEVGNTVAMQKCDALCQLATEVYNLTAKHPECESEI